MYVLPQSNKNNFNKAELNTGGNLDVTSYNP